MKCPECGEDLSKGHLCKKNENKIKGSSQEFEVEYKEFKLSEFLEIRRRKRGNPSLKDFGKIKKDYQKSPVNKRKTSFNADKFEGGIKGKKFLILFLMSLIGLALITALIFFTRGLF